MNIIGKSECTASQMAQYLINKNPNAKSWALEYAQLYLEEGEIEGVRGDGAWIQSCKETGNFMFASGTAVTFDQNNFCGLGVTSKGMKGHSFDTPRLGIRAQIQHLKGYATAAPLKNVCIDPRYKYINPKGKAPTFEELAGKWAVPGYDTSKASSLEDAMSKGIGYGFDIIKGVEQMKKIVVNNTQTNSNENVKEEAKMGYKVAIDAGHGSNTAGKRTPDGYREHWINVKCANYFDIAMKRCGFETVKISWDDTDSTDDTDVSLGARQTQIKNAKCDISVSWHANAHGDGKTYTSGQGIETFAHSESSKVADSKRLANCVHKYLIQGTKQTNRGVKSNNFAMCNCLAMGTKASILIETAFMTNEYESSLLKTDAFCLECAEEAAKGVCEYFGVAYKNGTGTTTIVPPIQNTNTVPARSYLMKGDKGADVKALQENLNYLGYNCGNADGDFGAKTDNALRKFQKAYKLTVDGKYGVTSKKTLEDAVAKKKNIASTPTPPSSVNYTYKGVNYSFVFNPTYYSNKYPDLKKAFGTNATKLFSHFCEYGMKEKRQAIDTFNVEVYKNNYADLRNAFGNDMPKYYEHYCKYGYKEKRKAI